MERIPKRKSPEASPSNEYIDRLMSGGFTSEQVQEALAAHTGEKEVGQSYFLNHTATDDHVAGYKKILDGLELHTKESFENRQRSSQRVLRFSRHSESLETPQEAA